MTDDELYHWDNTGYLIVPSVLTDAELKEANEAFDFVQDRFPNPDPGRGAKNSTALSGSKGRFEFHGLLELEKPHCEPFRKLIVHPAIVSRLNVMCGKGFRLDHGPLIVSGTKGTEGLTLHGSGEPHKPVVAYHHQNGRTHCNGVTVQYKLADVNEGDGGFVCVPGSHKAKFPMPEGIRTCDNDLGLVVQPPTKAGDVIFFMDGAQTHGTHAWTADHQRRSVLIKYTSNSAIRGAPRRELFEPESWWDDEIIEDMTDVEREVMLGPGVHHGGLVSGLEIDDDGNVFVDRA